MAATAHLWAIGYDDMDRADQVRNEIGELGWGPGEGGKYLTLLDMAVVVCHPDGTFTVNREPFRGTANILGSAVAGFLAGLVVAAPFTGATVGALVGAAGTASAAHAGISEDFIREVKELMKPGSSTLFVLDEAGDLEVIRHSIQGLGGAVLKTNVDTERAKLIQSTLAAPAGKSDIQGQ
jgi:uncharacterized membrane protein